MLKELLNFIEREKNSPDGKIPALFGNRLKYLRKAENLSQKQLAAKLGVNVSTYANWEQGRREPSLFDLYNLMWALNIDANELFDITE